MYAEAILLNWFGILVVCKAIYGKVGRDLLISFVTQPEMCLGVHRNKYHHELSKRLFSQIQWIFASYTNH